VNRAHYLIAQAPGPWVVAAACADSDISMEVAEPGGPARWHHTPAEAAAVAVCRTCPVLEPCRTWALTEPDPAVGHVAGGLTPRDRRWKRIGREN
jgi:hypothetical protein